MSDVMFRVEFKDDCVVNNNEGADVTFSKNVSFSEKNVWFSERKNKSNSKYHYYKAPIECWSVRFEKKIE